MRRDLSVYLWDIQHACAEILEFTSGKDLADYQSDRLVSAAVERCFTIIGEAMVRIGIHFPDEFSRISDAPRVIDFRNQLVHLYDQIDDSQVWEIITISIPILLQETTASIERLQR